MDGGAQSGPLPRLLRVVLDPCMSFSNSEFERPSLVTRLAQGVIQAIQILN